MRLILADKSSRDLSQRSATGERLINCYAVPAPEGSIAPYLIRNVPGTRGFSTLPGPFLRATAVIEGKLYAVCAGSLYRVEESGSFTWLAALEDDPNTSIAGHRDKITISAGGVYYVYDGAMTQPGGGRLGEIGSVAFLDQYTLLGERGGREIEWTEVGDPATRGALYFGTAEGGDDKIVRIVAAGGYLAVLKEKSTEVWQSTRLGGLSAFARIPGAVIDKGLLAYNLVCRTPAAVFFIGHDRVAYLGSGMQPQPVSSGVVDNALGKSTPSHVFYYEDRGHQFCVIRFPDRPAWVYDITMDRWHERSSGVEHGPWDIIAAEWVYGSWHLASRLGGIYRLGAIPTDADGPMRRTIVTRPIYNDGKKITIGLLEFLGEFGENSVIEDGPVWLLDQGGNPILDENQLPGALRIEEEATIPRERPARLWIRVSRDGGRTYGQPKVRDLGRTGEYEAKCRFRAMGQFTTFTAEVNMTDPVEISLLGHAIVE